jgi:hypothetical protein
MAFLSPPNPKFPPPCPPCPPCDVFSIRVILALELENSEGAFARSMRIKQGEVIGRRE